MDAEREQFEAAYRQQYPNAVAIAGLSKFSRDESDQYEDTTVQVAWRLWQARARLCPSSEASAPAAADLHAAIMNLPCRLPNEVMTDRMRSLYQQGHRDARHAAAELALAASPAVPAPSPQQDAWQPIETAPKDGTMFLVWIDGESRGEDDDGRPFVQSDGQVDFAQWRDNEHGGYLDCFGNPYPYDAWGASHWMALPTPPSGVRS